MSRETQTAHRSEALFTKTQNTELFTIKLTKQNVWLLTVTLYFKIGAKIKQDGSVTSLISFAVIIQSDCLN